MNAQAIRRRDLIEAHLRLAESDAAREHAATLLRGIDALTRKLAAMDPLPLDVIDRYERILVAAHVANLERVARVSERALLGLEGEA